MRIFLVVGVLVIVVGAVTVPLPWAVVADATFVSAAEVVTVTIDGELEAAAGPADRELSGEYLAVRHRNRAPASALISAAVDGGSRVERSGDTTSPRGVDPAVTAAMAGLGIVPRYADISELPVSATVGAGVDPRSLGVALHAFDIGAAQDVAQGRRILGVGRVLDGGSLECTPGVAASVRAAAAQRVDVVVVPTDCAADATGAVPQGVDLVVLDAPVLVSAAEALLGS
jgi:hypothetical protein